MTSDARPVPRSELVRSAILADLRNAGEPLPLAKMRYARQAAASSRELHVIATRLVDAGRLRRHGAGYHRGDPFRYELLSPF